MLVFDIGCLRDAGRRSLFSDLLLGRDASAGAAVRVLEFLSGGMPEKIKGAKATF